MKPVRLVVSLVAALACVGAAGCSSATEESIDSSEEALSSTLRVTCQSHGDRYRECDVDTDGGRIVRARVVRQLSSARCEEGRSWGYEDDYLWVDRGCRAEFEVRVRGGSSWGPEIVVFEHEDFQGESRTLRGPTPDFDRIGFNDRVSSIIVRRGTWELCRNDDFNGLCFIYEPGEYRRVWQNDEASSARPQ